MIKNVKIYTKSKSIVKFSTRNHMNSFDVHDKKMPWVDYYELFYLFFAELCQIVGELAWRVIAVMLVPYLLRI